MAQRLIVEVDGGQHNGSTTDARRDAFLHAEGFCVIRVWNNDVLQNMEGVMESIMRHLLARPHPDLPPRAGEGEKLP